MNTLGLGLSLGSNDREIAISWALDAVKDVLGTQNTRNKIIKTFFPPIKNAHHMKTFDAFQQYECMPFNDKENEILEYCEEIILLKNYVVFTATNIQENEDDQETHYQTYIVDNTNKILYAIDPAINPKKKYGYGIYKPMITYKTIQPFFEKNGYQFKYIKLMNPAQTLTEDVFCQSWTLYILLEVLASGVSSSNSTLGMDEILINIPKKQIDKYEILLNFYKQILVVESISDKLNKTYKSNVKKNKAFIKTYTTNFKNIALMSATDIILNMKPSDLMP
jgi:hypothetical protein